MKNETLRMEKVTYEDNGAALLDGMNLNIFEGEILGLLCINDYGKDALINLMLNNVPIRYGYVYFHEKLVNSYRHSSLSMNKVSIIEQRSRLVEDLTVADNIYVLRHGFKQYLINPNMLRGQFEMLIKELDINIDSGTLASELSSFEKCVTELLRAIVTGVKLVILRDISNFIGTADLLRFQNLIKHYTAQGVSFLYICSHHPECFQICDRVALMENGKVLKVLDRENFDPNIIPPYTLDFTRIPSPSLTGTSRNGMLKFAHVEANTINNLSFVVERGECVVMLDVSNTSLSSIVDLMTGKISITKGEILLDGANYSKNRFKNDICFIKENPLKTMLFTEMSYIDNLCFSLDRKNPFIWLDPRIKKSIAQEYGDLLGEDIYEQNISMLSAHSLYNLIYYRVHLYHPKIVFITQPFVGADMYLRFHIINLIRQLKARKITVVILAVSLSDCLNVADRLLKIEDGHLIMEYGSEEFYLFDTSSSKNNNEII